MSDPHKPQSSTLYRHFRPPLQLYRYLFTTGFPGGLGVPLMLARNATNSAKQPYEWVRISAGAGGPWTELDYRAVVYVALSTGAVYIRDEEEFRSHFILVDEPGGEDT